MKKYLIYLFAVCSILVYTSCQGYLDVIPEESAKDNDAFKDREAAKRYLYSCYSYLPNSRHTPNSLDMLTSDEVITAFEHEIFANFPKGNYTAVNPIISYWDILFQGIRQCYLLIDNVDDVPNLDSEDKLIYKSEATFLIAYYHYLLLKCYGPTLIIEGSIDVNMSQSAYPERQPYDECVEWISNKFDEAVSLGLPNSHEGTSYGRATKPAALAIKARMLLYAASPLFNGGRANYSDPTADDVSTAWTGQTTSDGKPLFNTTYDAGKWQKAAEAASAAIASAEAAGIRLYQENDVPSSTSVPEPSNITEKVLRLTITDRTTPEIIWADTRVESIYGIQKKSTPFNDTKGGSWNGAGPTMTMLGMFYTKNGLPIDEDPDYDYSTIYGYGNQPTTEHGTGITLNLNLNREPRFYSWVAYHNSYYELYALTTDLGASSSSRNKMLVQFRKNDNCGIKTRTNNYSPTGYLNKKGVHPGFSRETGGTKVDYPWPIIRLAELYLNYAEALIEVGGQQNLETAITYIDKVRTRAGIQGVKASWLPTGKTLDQAKLRQIVRQERTIELYLENQRFWDVRRWLLGTKYFNVKAKGLNISQTTDAGFFNVVEVNFTRKFTSPTNYLMPIPASDIDKNVKLVQNPGY